MRLNSRTVFRERSISDTPTSELRDRLASLDTDASLSGLERRLLAICIEDELEYRARGEEQFRRW